MVLQGGLDSEGWLAAADKAGAAAGPTAEVQLHAATPLPHGCNSRRNERANDCIMRVLCIRVS